MIVIVGGGIIGLASAYHLAERGYDVTVCERTNLGTGSTERAVGGIRAQFSTPINITLSNYSIDVWERFEDEFGIDIEYRQHGYMFLAAEEETLDTIRDNVALQQEHDVPSEYLEPEDAKEILPELHVDRFLGGSFSGRDGSADPHLAVQGFSEAIRELGGDIRTDVEVHDVVFENGGPSRVETSDGDIPADYVVNAAGPWAADIGSLAGLDLPVTPKRRQVGVVRPEIPYPEDAPMVFDMDSGIYFLPDRDGDALMGGHFGGPDPDIDPADYSKDYDLDWITEALELASDVSEHFGLDSEIKNGWAGLYAITPDHKPIIEETRPGFINAVGFSGHGFMHSPAVGTIVADLVEEGETSLIDLDVLSSDRFEGAAVEGEKNVL
ncbi:MAG: FAD-binding oxidoreductase [Halobacteriales archaeon]